MEWQFNAYTIGLISATLVSLGIASVAFQHRQRSGAQSLSSLMLAIAIWSFGYIFEANAIEIPLKVFWSQVAYVGTTSAPVFLLIFTARLVHRDRWLTRMNRALLWVIPTITLILAITNSRHGLVWSGYEFVDGTRHIITYAHGPWFWVFVAFVYGSFVVVLLLLLVAAKRMHQIYRRQSLAIVLGMVPATTVNILYILAPGIFNGRDWTPVSFCFSAGVLAWAFSELRLLNLVPVAKDIVLDSIHDGVLVISADRLIVDANPAAGEILTLDNIIGCDLAAAFANITELSNAPDFEMLPFIGRTGNTATGRQATDLSGLMQIAGKRTIEWQIARIGRHNVHLPGCIMILRDITEQRAAAEAQRTLNATLEIKVSERTAAIRAQKEQSDAILRSVSDSIFMTDRDLVIRFVNPAFTQLTGYSYDEALGEPIRDFVGDNVYHLLREAQAGGQVWQGEAEARLKSGRHKEVELTVSPVHDDGGSTVGYVCTARDITRTRNLERARKGILDNISHQLRTPVTTLKLYTHLLKKADLSERHHRSLEIIEDQVQWLQNIIEDILEMTALDSGQAIGIWERVPVVTLMDLLIERYQQRAAQAQLHLSLVPAAPTQLEVQGDEARLIQALGEIMENAITFTAANGCIELSFNEKSINGEPGVEIQLRDTGPGIPEDEQPRAFERFFRGRITDSGHIPGAGLGLNIAQSIITAHHGQISLESSDQGTTVTTWLPTTVPVAESMPRQSEACRSTVEDG